MTSFFKNDTPIYRSISKLCILGKSFEKIICGKIIGSVDVNIIPTQHGFCKQRSTKSNLITFVDNLLELMNGRFQIDTVLNKAFNRVDHFLLVDSFHEIGIPKYLLEQVWSYLTKCKQVVILKVFFLITMINLRVYHKVVIPHNYFLNDIKLCLVYCKFLIYADVINLFHKATRPKDCVFIQDNLSRLSNYSLLKGFPLSLDKCATIYLVSVVKNLGVTLDEKLLFQALIEKFIKQILWSLEKNYEYHKVI